MMMNFFALFFVIFVALTASARPEVIFERDIEVSDRSPLTWADLAVVKNGTEELFAELRSVEYKGGGSGEIRARLRERKRAAGIYARLGVGVLVPQSMKVRKVQGYSAVEFRRKLQARLESVCADCRFEIRSVRDANIRVSSDWRIDESTVHARNQLLVQVNSEAATVWIAVQNRVVRPALVVRRFVPAGQKISVGDVENKDADAGALRENPATIEDLTDAVAVRPLVTGQIVTLADIKREEAVKRGQTVKLSASGEDYEVSINAVAEGAGRPGDVIKVKNTETGKTMTAVITGQGQARLQ